MTDKILKLLQEAYDDVKDENKARIDKIQLDVSLSDLGIDSILALEMISYIEDKLDIQFPDDELSSIATVPDFYDLIKSKIDKNKILLEVEAT